MCETSQNNFSKSYIVVIDFSSDWFKCVAMRQVWLGESDGGEGGGGECGGVPFYRMGTLQI